MSCFSQSSVKSSERYLTNLVLELSQIETFLYYRLVQPCLPLPSICIYMFTYFFLLVFISEYICHWNLKIICKYLNTVGICRKVKQPVNLCQHLYCIGTNLRGKTLCHTVFCFTWQSYVWTFLQAKTSLISIALK